MGGLREAISVRKRCKGKLNVLVQAHTFTIFDALKKRYYDKKKDNAGCGLVSVPIGDGLGN